MKPKLIGIGYWQSYTQPFLPSPGDSVKNYFNTQQIYDYTKILNSSKIVAGNQMGFSWCRFRCGEINMGNKEYTNGIYIWPEGLVHYVNEHNIILPNEFLMSISSEFVNINLEFGYEIDYTFWINYCSQNNISNYLTFKAEFDIGYLSVVIKNPNDLSILNSIYLFLTKERFGAKKDNILNFLKTNGNGTIIGRFYNLNVFLNEMKHKDITLLFTPFNDEEYLMYQEGILQNGIIH